MAGTKMILKRYGDASSPYRYYEIIVDAEYLAGGHGVLVTLPYPYMMNLHMLDVWYNGQYLLSGGGYEEVDEFHILLDIRVPNEDNTDLVKITELLLGDELSFRIWNQPPIYNNSEDDVRKLGYIMGEGNYDILYEYDEDSDYPKKETVVGDYNVTKSLTYTSFGKPETETVQYNNRTIVRTFVYDPDTYNLLKVQIRTTIS